MYYEVEVREVLTRTIIVRAKSAAEAREKAENRWHLGFEPMGEDDFSHAEFHVGAMRNSFTYAELFDNLIGGPASVGEARKNVATLLEKKEAEIYLPEKMSKEDRIDAFIRKINPYFDEDGKIVNKEAA